MPTPQPGNVQLSILIVNWNTRDLLARCLASIYAHPPSPAFEVIVVDNASTDGSPAMVRERFPQVRLIENGENVGFARANNQAIRESRGAYLLLLNSDTLVLPAAFDRLLAFMAAHPRAGMVGPRVLNPDGSLQPSCTPFPTLAREAWRMFHGDRIRPWAVYAMTAWDVETPREVDVLMGAALLVRRQVIDEIGLLDEAFFMYSEEVDWCLRAKKAGWKVWWEPRAQIIHYGGQSSKQASEKMFLHLYRSKVLFFRKHYGPLQTTLYKGILALASLPRLLLAPLAMLQSPPQKAQNRHLAARYRHLLTEVWGY